MHFIYAVDSKQPVLVAIQIPHDPRPFTREDEIAAHRAPSLGAKRAATIAEGGLWSARRFSAAVRQRG